MKRFFFAMLAGAMLAACVGGEDGTPEYGTIAYGGKVYPVDRVVYHEVEVPSVAGAPAYVLKFLQIGSLSGCGLVLQGVDPAVGFVVVDGAQFFCGGKEYFSLGEDDGLLPSLAVDPATGKGYGPGEGPVRGGIVDCGVVWEVGGGVARYEFSLVLDNGKSVEGSGEVPLSMLK